MCLITVVYVCDHVSGIFETADGESWCPRQTASTVVCWPVGREEQWVGESNRWIYLNHNREESSGNLYPCGGLESQTGGYTSTIIERKARATCTRVVFFPLWEHEKCTSKQCAGYGCMLDSGRKSCLRQIKWICYRIDSTLWLHIG